MRHQPARHPALALLALAVLAGCSSDPPTIHLDITTGQETDAFSIEPKVVRVDVTATSLDGTVEMTASAEPGGSFDLGDVTVDQRLTFDVAGIDASGATVVRGRSLSGLLVGGVEDTVRVFAQRTNQWARPPGGFKKSHAGAPAVVLGEQYILSSGGAVVGDDSEGSAATASYYDLFGFAGAGGDALPRAPATMLVRSEALLLINADGATVIDYAAEAVADIDPPTGLASFADVAGGRVIEATDGRTFVVGATRAGEATKGILIVDADGVLSAVQLTAARAGAAAAWVEGVGLVVAGGSADAPGVEVLAEKATAFATRAFPPDAVTGAGAVVAATGGLVLLGGTLGDVAQATRLVDPACAMVACNAEIMMGAELPAAMTGVVAFSLGGSRLVVVGDEATTAALTKSFLVDLSGGVTEELPLREPRRGATAVPAPNGTLALVGGAHEDGTPALAVEMFFPE